MFPGTYCTPSPCFTLKYCARHSHLTPATANLHQRRWGIFFTDVCTGSYDTRFQVSSTWQRSCRPLPVGRSFEEGGRRPRRAYGVCIGPWLESRIAESFTNTKFVNTLIIVCRIGTIKKLIIALRRHYQKVDKRLRIGTTKKLRNHTEIFCIPTRSCNKVLVRYNTFGVLTYWRAPEMW